MDENEKTAHLLSQRQYIQEQRKAANMAASLHRNKVNQLMESMKNVHNLEKLAPGGSVVRASLVSCRIMSIGPHDWSGSRCVRWCWNAFLHGHHALLTSH